MNLDSSGSSADFIDVTPTVPNGHLPLEGTSAPASQPLQAPIRGSASRRNAVTYEAVINQFGVALNERYTSRAGDAVFACDVLKAMGIEVPRCSGANELLGWLEREGAAWGFRRVVAQDTALAAAKGHPALVIDQQPHYERPGRVSVVRPGSPRRVVLARGGENASERAALTRPVDPARRSYWVADVKPQLG
ncbi:MAG: hypothetical protein JNK82_25370 [Myxococcaceae bacterium]|nr:hypothetical protein [Myxococcaceae bacterium]